MNICGKVRVQKLAIVTQLYPKTTHAEEEAAKIKTELAASLGQGRQGH